MKKKDYHDYVLKDGQFIGQFDKMYQDCADPWMQSKQPNKYSRTAGIIHMLNFKIKSVLECGSGLGYYADWIHRETGIVTKSIDISETAVMKAKRIFPKLDFEVSDITKNLANYKNYECVLFSEIVWYILPSLDKIIDDLKKHFPEKYLLVNQVFYKGTQKYGTDYFTSQEGFMDYMPFTVRGYSNATTEHDSTIETSTLFKIKE